MERLSYKLLEEQGYDGFMLLGKDDEVRFFSE